MSKLWIVTSFDKDCDGKFYQRRPMMFKTWKEADIYVQQEKETYWEDTWKFDDEWDEHRDGYEDYVMGGDNTFRQWNIWEPR